MKNHYPQDAWLSTTMRTETIEPFADEIFLSIVDQVIKILDKDVPSELEPTPISSSNIQVVAEFSINHDPTWNRSSGLVLEVIDALAQKSNGITNSNKTSTDLEDHHTKSKSSDSPSSPSPKRQRIEPARCSSQFETGTVYSIVSQTDVSTDVYLEDEDENGNVNNERRNRFRSYQAEQWLERFQEMVAFKHTRGHCCVPNTFPENPSLAQWVKRQRYQYKLKEEGKHSTLTEERKIALDELGFVWLANTAAWMERWSELEDFHRQNGHSSVPTHYLPNRQLSIWVKCQRRQYKLFHLGKRSNMTWKRIEKLEALDFVWNPRGLKS